MLILLSCERSLNILQRHAVFEQRRRISQDLILLSISALREDFGYARDLQQPGTNDPVRRGAECHLLLFGRGKPNLMFFAVNGHDSTMVVVDMLVDRVFRLEPPLNVFNWNRCPRFLDDVGSSVSKLGFRACCHWWAPVPR